MSAIFGRPICLRSFVNDAGIRTEWLVGEWPRRTEIADIFLEDPPRSVSSGLGISRIGDIISIDLFNASARYRIDGRTFRGVAADLIDREIRHPEP